MYKNLILLGVIISLVFAAVPLSAMDLGIRAYYWMPGLDGDMNYDSGTKLDLEDDLGTRPQAIHPGARRLPFPSRLEPARS